VVAARKVGASTVDPDVALLARGREDGRANAPTTTDTAIITILEVIHYP
jgi:hypothetical protein